MTSHAYELYGFFSDRYALILFLSIVQAGFAAVGLAYWDLTTPIKPRAMPLEVGHKVTLLNAGQPSLCCG